MRIDITLESHTCSEDATAFRSQSLGLFLFLLLISDLVDWHVLSLIKVLTRCRREHTAVSLDLCDLGAGIARHLLLAADVVGHGLVPC